MRISGLYVYPLKSGRGASLESAEVGPHALENDRRFMAIKPDGTFLSQRQRPRMAMIETRIDGDVVELRAPDRAPQRFVARGQGEARQVSVWDSPCEVVDQGEDAASWLSAVLETPARLVAMAEGYRRPMHEFFPREHDGQLTFADAAPFLVISQGSLDDLNGRLAAPVPMSRFRPNVVISGCEPYAEDAWAGLHVGDLDLTRLVLCGRCAIVTTDQETLERGEEPLRTLATYRKDPDLGVVFGSYYAHRGTGTLSVGDAVEAIQDAT